MDGLLKAYTLTRRSHGIAKANHNSESLRWQWVVWYLCNSVAIMQQCLAFASQYKVGGGLHRPYTPSAGRLLIYTLNSCSQHTQEKHDKTNQT